MSESKRLWCYCTSPTLPLPGDAPWCGRCCHDIHRDTIKRLRKSHEARIAAAERDAKDLLYSLGAP